MKTLQANIGLNNNKYNVDELINYLEQHADFNLLSYNLVNGEYLSSEEPTLVCVLGYRFSRASQLLLKFEQMADVLEQDCIAFKAEGIEALAYSHSFSGSKMVFDSQYFIEYK